MIAGQHVTQWPTCDCFFEITFMSLVQVGEVCKPVIPGIKEMLIAVWLTGTAEIVKIFFLFGARPRFIFRDTFTLEAFKLF